MKYFLVFLTSFIISSITVAQNNPLIKNPNISPNGLRIAFNYQGDIWTINTNGTNLKRITIHEADDNTPVWSKDGKSLAFSSNRFGNYDVFTISANGGVPKRITYHSANDKVSDYTIDNEIIFSTHRNFVEIEWDSEINKISDKGGTPFRILDAVGFDATISPNKKFIAFTRGSCRIEREAYKGSANKDIWIYNTENKKFYQITTFNGQDYLPKWGSNSKLYFLSARTGKYNIHMATISNNGQKTGKITPLSSVKNIGLFSYDISKNGVDIVMNAGDKTWLLNAITKTVKPISITINTDYRFNPIVRKTYTNNASEITISPNGKLSAFVVRGEIFITQNKTKKDKTINLSNSPYRDLDVVWLNDKTILFISDRNGVNNLYKVTSINNKNIFTSLKHQITQLTFSKKGITTPSISPDKKLITFLENNSKLIIASISKEGKISNKKTLLNNWNVPSQVTWSPDSKWITYSIKDLYFNNEIYIHKADGTKKPVNISMHPKNDFGAIWSKDGSKIVFSSNRNNGDYDVWFVWLTKKDWEKTQQDWDEPKEEEEKYTKKEDIKDQKETPKEIVIDFDKIYERQVQVTSFTGGEFAQGISKDGKTIFFSTGYSGRGNGKTYSDLYKIKWNGKEKTALTKGNSYPSSITFTEKQDYVYFTTNGRINRIKLAATKKENIPFKAKMKINYTKESNQIFEEAWTIIKNRFYDPNYHGKNWEKLKEIYKPLALKASTRSDFKFIFNKMLGQINASHMGMYRGEERAKLSKEKTGLLGIEFANKNGKLKIKKVIPNTAASRESSKLIVGDIIKTVNGNPVSANKNIYKHLANTANEKVLLEIERQGTTKEMVIRPKASKRNYLYKVWVAERKRLTDKYSNGQLGYIHIQGMNWTSFEHFERELTAAGHGKKGIVIDVRYNGGGWTTDHLMAVLNVKQHAYTIPRGATNNVEKNHTKFEQYYPYSERLPLAAWTKPSIAICNQNSYSNAEIFSHAYKELKIGTLVGVPTFGAVISTGGQTLIDGSYVRVPFRGWFVKSSGKNMDFNPATPDIIVKNNPNDKVNGIDTQLKKAVNTLLNQL